MLGNAASPFYREPKNNILEKYFNGSYFSNKTPLTYSSSTENHDDWCIVVVLIAGTWARRSQSGATDAKTKKEDKVFTS